MTGGYGPFTKGCTIKDRKLWKLLFYIQELQQALLHTTQKTPHNFILFCIFLLGEKAG